MENRMDQYQAGFISSFESLEARMDQQQVAIELLHQRIECTESHQQEEMMAYLRFVFPPPPPQP